MQQYQVILFDLDGTLFDFPAAQRIAFHTLCEAFPLPSDEKYYQSYHEINDMLWKKLERGEVTRQQLMKERFRLTFSELEGEEDWARANQIYFDGLSRCGILFDGAEALCRDLSEKYRLVAVTNGFLAAQTGRMERSAVKKYFSAMAVSQEVEHGKPAPDVFELGLKRIGHSGVSDVLVIGDSYDADIMGGFHLGADTMWYNPSERALSRNMPTYTVKSYDEIREALL